MGSTDLSNNGQDGAMKYGGGASSVGLLGVVTALKSTGGKRLVVLLGFLRPSAITLLLNYHLQHHLLLLLSISPR